MSTYKELAAQLQELEKKVKEARKSESATAIATIQDLVAEFELSVADVFPNKVGRPVKKSGPAPAMYRNPNNPLQTWSGNGRVPQWMASTPKEERHQFAI